MKWHRHARSPGAGGEGSKSSSKRERSHSHARHRGWRRFAIVLLVLVILLGIGRAFLPTIVRNYVNRTLDRNLLYEGRIGDIEIHLWRGAYAIRDIQVSKRTGQVPVPFFAAKRLDFSIQWDALIHRRVVGQLVMQQPELNFVSNPDPDESQTGGNTPWLQLIRDLFPFKINRAFLQNGTVHFRTYKSEKPVDIYISQVNGTIDDLSNIRNETKPLVTTVQVTGMAMDQAKLEIKMLLDPFSYRPTFHLALRLLGLDVTKLNDFALTYGKFDFKRGWFDLVIEADSKEGQLTGYVKPLFRDLKVFSLAADLSEDNALQFIWQALVGGATTLFKNFRRDQFGTLIPFTGDATGTTSADILATIGNILRNAFVRAYLPYLENGQAGVGELKFEAPSLIEELSTANRTEQ